MTAILTSTLVVLAGAYLADRASSQTPLIDTLNSQATKIKTARHARCLSTPRFRWHPGHLVPRHMRAYVIQQRAARLEATRAIRAVHVDCPESYWWSRTSAAVCVSSNEGGLRTNTGNGYYGRWQADIDFQKAYGPEFYYRLGTANNWRRWQQDVMAYSGWQARGWSPWPNTSRMCGL